MCLFLSFKLFHNEVPAGNADRYHVHFSLLSGAAMMLAELAMEAGLPKGVLNIVHGTNVSSLIHSFLGNFPILYQIDSDSIIYTNLVVFPSPDYCDFLFY
jgi:hypothetical protein